MEEFFGGSIQNRKARIGQTPTGECGVYRMRTAANSVHVTALIW